jgi:hypothetical protein
MVATDRLRHTLADNLASSIQHDSSDAGVGVRRAEELGGKRDRVAHGSTFGSTRHLDLTSPAS